MLRTSGPRRTSVPHTLRIVGTWLRHILARERRSLRGRLLYTLLGLLVVLLLVEVWQHSTRLRARDSLLRQAHLRTATAAADTFHANLAQLYRTQRLIGRTVISGRMPEGQIQPYLEEVLSQFQGMASVQIISPDGTVRYAAPAPGYDNSVADEPFFRALTPQTPYHLSDVYVDSPQTLPKVRISSLLASREAAAECIVSMEFFTYALREFVSRRRAGQTEVLLDSAGQVAYSPEGSNLAQAIAADPEFARAIKLERGTPVDVRRPDGEDLMGHTARIPDTKWTVAYLRPEQESLASIGKDTRVSLVVALLVVTIMGLAIFAVTWMSLRPLVRLSAATRMLGNLDLEFRLPRPEVEEFELLVDSFNRMAGELEKAHTQLKDANRFLEERVAERTRQLREEHDKLLRSERLSSLGLLSSAIAHDLRNPLNTVALNLHWLRMRVGPSLDERAETKLAAMERELRRADRIIGTLLAFARTGEPNREPTDLNRLAREVVDGYDAPAEVEIDLRLDPGLPVVAVDATQFYQVLENLLKNAVQAMEGRGRIRLETKALGDLIRISVADSGPGIPSELIDNVFEPLVTTKSSGTGIGLALCKRIIEAHGGTISVESRVGQGAVFRIQLPVISPAPGSGPSPGREVTPAGA